MHNLRKRVFATHLATLHASHPKKRRIDIILGFVVRDAPIIIIIILFAKLFGYFRIIFEGLEELNPTHELHNLDLIQFLN
jgi:hypothetical protein